MKILVVLVACVSIVSACNNGEFRRHSECTKFQRCDHGVWKDFDCAPGTHWNQAILTCDWPSSAGCVPGVSDPASPTDNCNPNPCQNSGSCTSTSSGFQCTCTGQYTGERCETYSAPQTGEVLCASGLPGTQCLNGGACVWFNKFSCSCKAGYTGSRCEYPLIPVTTAAPSNACSNNPCLNNGKCTVSGNTFNCECPANYAGRTCEVFNNPCDSSPCGVGGFCSSSDTNFFCSCRGGYTGYRCENRDFCFDQDCSQRGQCVSKSTGFECTCDTGYTGERCEYNDFCASNPCINGTCYNEANSYRCVCPEGYYGNPCIDCSKLWQCPLNRMPYVVPDVTDDTKYIICSNGTMATYNCSANLKYDPLQLQCL